MRLKNYLFDKTLRRLATSLALAAGAAICVIPSAHAQKRPGPDASADDVFIALRAAAASDNGALAQELAARLGSYDLVSYVDYYRLKPRVRDYSASEQEVRDFLTRYDGQAIVDRLRNDWLLALGKTGNWALFDEQYPKFVLDDDTQVKCFALNSRALKGANVADEARALLVNPKDYGQGCSDLIATLAQNGQFSQADVWFQIRQAAENGNTTVARRAAVLVDNGVATVPQVMDKPTLMLAKGPGEGAANHQLYIIALGRIAKSNPAQAATYLNGAARQMTSQEVALGWAQIALAASYKLAPEAADYWRKTLDAPLSQDAMQWKVRMALRAGDWKTVRGTIAGMPVALRNDITWVYWLGRALREDGQNDAARRLFESISGNFSFYGQLALEELGQKITVPPGPTPPGAGEIAVYSQNAGFKRSLRFYQLNLRFEAIREWNWELRKMTDRQLLAAAEYARQSDVLDRMVNTSDRTRAEFDFTQRFPAPHLPEMNAATRPLGMENAWVYGLIRQESRFIKSARSHVGASGLMQLMPATAKFVAKKIGMTEFTADQVNDINTNLLLGTSYLDMVLNNMNGSETLATAGYNAGPGRPRTWRATLPRTVEGAIFAEMIPFNETRGYVKNVMSNATYYAAMFENRPQSLKQRMGNIAPNADAATDLP
ncbi:lytic transglycosylase domain-containing protein [Herbaspirillum sp. alder98]|uniref:lytic transglycosylase domain-containing protein n=1 Tax=Herbaspirillum sp. alder98 TaxID=2913096 RepID=UPI001CD8BA76|nr:lytic transglycosylase domain-containing protein [Herbaspirillum sp. alder98]MCA1324267.1 lytic transglycosylase domain-containing protein [Herbaspirillum sp. alder98]